MIIKAPKNFTVNYIYDFLLKVNKTFYWKDKLVDNVKIDFSTIRSIDILGLLIIYKYIDYTYTNYCFKKPELIVAKYINEVWSKYEFDNLFQAYISNRGVTEKAYKDFKVILEDKFIIAPQALLRKTNYTNEYLNREFIPKIESYYRYDSKCTDLIFSCFSEILLNFWEHAVKDTQSVIIADGNKSKIEIACADTGIGLISNLQNVFKDSKPENLISRAVERGVTSKPNTNHMGFGLWIVSELVKANNGRLHIFSQGYFYHIDYNKVTKGICPYWPGTVIYVNLNLKEPKTISKLLESDISNKIKINFT